MTILVIIINYSLQTALYNFGHQSRAVQRAHVEFVESVAKLLTQCRVRISTPAAACYWALLHVTERAIDNSKY